MSRPPHRDDPLALLCTVAGEVESVLLGDSGAPGQPLSLQVAGESLGQLHRLLRDATKGAARSAIQMKDGELRFCAAASTGHSILLVGAPSRSQLVRAVEALRAEHPDLERAAQAILGQQDAEELTAAQWDELSALNNELVTARRALARQNAELQALNQQKNQLLGMAAHDLRNPLGAIRAYLEFIALESATLTPDQMQLLDRARQNVHFMLALVDDVLDLSAIESGTVRLELSRFGLGPLIEEAREVATVSSGRRVVVRLAPPELPIAEIDADRRKLLQVAENLISNAIKFSSDDADPVVVRWGERKDCCWFSVSDGGIGIAAEDLERIFTPFARASKPRMGERSTGLGLAISKRVVAAHGGSIALESEPGQGTTVTVEIPAATSRGAS